MNKQPTNEQVLMQVAQTFLQRADLKGGEVDNYAKCFNFIQTIVEGGNVVVPAVAFKEGLDAIQEVKDLRDGALPDLAENEDTPVLPDKDTPALKPVEDTSGDENMVSEGGPLNELEDVE